ncbi:4-hydroxyacetophenone monooxygenase [Colletotrichum karsti]|uniref:4-hydroxyacetophenone monooxygenase n=1 Tax=Colletotrichum karsti TaxID=1095194 RepID=A0A9P6IAW7_9PEZI|nr:4-hydroxyacetophenone monooxygenase [Colletotrichum karsti]KAF9877191.1 4-hydroxyacetophenone monooxygenase [Colletotrichum karsti]
MSPTETPQDKSSTRTGFRAEDTKSHQRGHDKYFPNHAPWEPFRPVNIIIVGAGIGGVTSAVMLSHKINNATIDVFDRLPKIGGTWAANVYPGVRCDVPSHAYQLSCEPNTEWSEYYPKGAEIQAYYDKVIEKHGLTDSVHLRHEIVKATWLSEASQWAIEIRNLQNGQVFVKTADFFVNAQGRISNPKYPDIPGLHDVFQGQVVHTARWPRDINIEGKRVAVIGNGASGQQILPNILPQVAHLDHYVRTKTWVTPTFAGDLHEATSDSPGGPKYSDEEKQRFRQDPAYYLAHRRAFEVKFHNRFAADVLGSKENADLREKLVQCMRERLGGDEEWLERVLPDYAPGCKRLTPAPGYLEGLKSDKANYIARPISRVNATGIIDANGTHREVDVIIAATGFDTTYSAAFPLLGNNGLDLAKRWATDGEIGYPETYLGMMAPGFPNYFTVLQAQGNARGGTVPVQIEISATYIAKCIRKIQTQSYASLNPREDAAQEFNDIVNGYFDNKVTADRCNSWFKQGAGATHVLIAWPGTFHHRADILRDPRWEDFEFVRRPGSEKNRFEYFGNGQTAREVRRDEEDITGYLREIGKIDIATIHEAWNT